MGLVVGLGFEMPPFRRNRIEDVFAVPFVDTTASAGAQQVPIQFLLQLGYRHKSEQVMSVELRQLSGINAIRFILSPSGAGVTGGGDDIAVIAAIFSEIPLRV